MSTVDIRVRSIDGDERFAEVHGSETTSKEILRLAGFPATYALYADGIQLVGPLVVDDIKDLLIYAVKPPSIGYRSPAAPEAGLGGEYLGYRASGPRYAPSAVPSRTAKGGRARKASTSAQRRLVKRRLVKRPVSASASAKAKRRRVTRSASASAKAKQRRRVRRPVRRPSAKQ